MCRGPALRIGDPTQSILLSGDPMFRNAVSVFLSHSDQPFHVCHNPHRLHAVSVYAPKVVAIPLRPRMDGPAGFTPSVVVQAMTRRKDFCKNCTSVGTSDDRAATAPRLESNSKLASRPFGECFLEEALGEFLSRSIVAKQKGLCGSFVCCVRCFSWLSICSCSYC